MERRAGQRGGIAEAAKENQDSGCVWAGWVDGNGGVGLFLQPGSRNEQAIKAAMAGRVPRMAALYRASDSGELAGTLVGYPIKLTVLAADGKRHTATTTLKVPAATQPD